MRHVALGLLLVACSHHHGAAPDDSPPASDAPAIDAGSSACAPAVPLAAACTPVVGSNVSLVAVGQLTGAASALLATSPPNDGRLFVVGQGGQIWIDDGSGFLPDPFIDITDDTMLLAEAPPGERGLLGLAFHPSFACNGYFYVDYTTASADVVERFSVSQTDPNKADPTSGEIILSIPDPAENHNGGMIQFGSDGYLYVATGDGGDEDDPWKNGQAIWGSDPTCIANGCEPLLSKMLRIDVDHPANGKQYGIPPSNPYATNGSAEPEILIRGLRNPWRWSFDSATGDMYIADVGQDTWEEVDVLPAAQIEGSANNPVNLGWSMYEGSACYNDGNGNGSCSPVGMTFPEYVWSHTTDGWHAVIGAAVYRGTCYPSLDGNFYLSDNTLGGLWQTAFNPLMPPGSRLAPPVQVAPLSGPSSVHANEATGEIYVTDTNGDVYHLEASP